MKRPKRPTAITPAEMNRVYKKCLKRERDRERKKGRTKQGAFDRRILHFDMMSEESLERENSVSWLTDHGRGAAAIRRGVPPTVEELKRRRALCINRARMAISRTLPECLPTFHLVLKNETNSKESIWETMMRLKRKKVRNGGPQEPSISHRSKK